MAGASSSRGVTARRLRTIVAPPAVPRLGNSGVLRIQQELRTLMHEPVPFIYVSAEEHDVTKITALIVGPLETPYAGGFFRFEIRVVPEYPMKPPKVHLQTTDGGRVRFNPNLYDNGNVCLSILGTWTGPAWSSAETLSSVLLSIQSLMCPHPYHNEPGFESRGDPATVAAYNDYIRFETLRVAVVGTMNHPSYSDHFPVVCDRLFLLWYPMYMSTAKDLQSRLEGTHYNDAFSMRRGRYVLQPIIDALVQIKERLLFEMRTLDTVDEDDDDSLIPPTPPEKTARSYSFDRLQDEHRLLKHNPPASGSASPRDIDYPFVWDATILGLENTPWEGGLFSLEIRFAASHPTHPPFACFTSKVFHPNITKDGIPALDLIQTRWSPDTRITTILDQLQTLLANPSSVYPVNLEAAQMFFNDRRGYQRRIRRMAQDGC